MFPESSFDISFQPLSYKVLVHEVLLREAAALLIQQDLGFDRAKAIKTLTRSQAFGTMLHPGDDSPHIQAIIDKTTRAVQRQEALFRLWKASDSSESFGDWVREQKSLEEDARIKVEENETILPVEGSSGDAAMEEIGFRAVANGTDIVYELID
jgi:RTC4-like domain